MKFGIFDHMDRAGDDIGQQYEDRLRLTEAYDEAGFYAYHLAEHHSTPLGLAPSPGLFLSAVAQRTKNLRIGALVYTLSLYHPLRLFEEICMLDQLSGGRVELGIGRGISPIEMGFYGVGLGDANEIYIEASEILAQAFATKTINYSGKHFSFSDVPVEMSPRQKPHPPMWYGVGRPETTIWAAGQGLNIVCNGTADSIREITDRFRLEWAAAGQAPAGIPLLGMSRHIVVGETSAEAVGLAREAYDQWFRGLNHLWKQHGRQVPLSFPENFNDAVESGFCLAGSASEVREKLLAETDVAGVNYILARMAFGNLPLGASLNSVRLFADEVMPAFSAPELASV